MSDPNRTLTQRMDALLDAPSDVFSDLIRAAELDPDRALVGADLKDADMTGSDLTNYRLIGSDLSRVTGLTAEMLAVAITDETTRLPPGMREAVRVRRSRNAFWESGRPPSWADDWGYDDYKTPWVTFAVESADGAKVVQRMRWIPPGEFLIGSPPDENGRYDDEGPQVPIEIADGFWLFDTPCTQALWEAVIGTNPSTFKSPARPVENVSFHMARRFIRALNKRLPGLDLGLPSEAYWEYACRAGTATARYAEDVDAIAWYDDNSGGETHAVGERQPNNWGLHDMLGNVWEWCEDAWLNRHEGRPPDGAPWRDAGGAANRVLRGGSWIFAARNARSADRIFYAPSDRHDDIGFRCARVQWERKRLASGAERAAGRGQGGKRSDRTARPATRGA